MSLGSESLAKSVVFYGRELALVLARSTGKLGAPMQAIVMRCPAPTQQIRTKQLVRCDTPIQYYTTFRPAAFVCPACFAILVVDDEKAAPDYADADLDFDCANGVRTYCYGTYAGHRAQATLYGRIMHATGNNGFLVAPCASGGGAELITGPNKQLRVPYFVGEQDFTDMVVPPRILSHFVLSGIVQCAASREYAVA